jgi:hypothetical protein
MLDIESIMAGKPIPPVRAADMERVWEFIFKDSIGEVSTTPTVGFNLRVITGQCGPDADLLASFVRATILKQLLEEGLLDAWRDGKHPNGTVFQVLASFPLPDGTAGFRSDEFIDVLRKAQ